jgi:hypothetical protein
MHSLHKCTYMDIVIIFVIEFMPLGNVWQPDFHLPFHIAPSADNWSCLPTIWFCHHIFDYYQFHYYCHWILLLKGFHPHSAQLTLYCHFNLQHIAY